MAIQYPPAEAGPSRLPAYKLTQSIAAHERAVTALKFSPNGKILASAGADGVLHFWNSDDGDHIQSLRCHRQGINDISISPDGLYVSTASDDTTSQIHLVPSIHQSSSTFSSISNPIPPLNGVPTSLHRPKPLRHLKSHTAPILCVAFSPKSNLLVTGSFDESAIVWDVRRGKVLRVLPAHAEAIWSVCWDNEGGMVVTGSADGLIRLWDANNGQCLKTLDNDTNSPVSFSTFTPSSFFLLSSTLSSTIRLTNFHTAKVLKTLRSPGVYINEKYPCPAVVYESLPTRSPSSAVVNGADIRDRDHMDLETEDEEQGQRQVHVHSTSDKESDGAVLESLPDQSAPSIAANLPTTNDADRDIIRKRKKEAWVVAGSENGRLIIWDIQSRRVLQVLGGSEKANDGEEEGREVAREGDGGGVLINGGSADAEKGKMSPDTGGHLRPVIALAVHPNGRMIVSGSLEPEKVINIWRDDKS